MTTPWNGGPQGPDACLMVAESHQSILEVVAGSLRYAGFEIVCATTGSEAIETARRCRPDVMVLDIVLPDRSGFDVTKQLRGNGLLIPAVFLTRGDTPLEQVLELILDGDDYVMMPFSLQEVTARIRAILCRTRGDGHEPTRRLQFADLELDMDSREVRRAGRQIQLSLTEFRLLKCFMENANQLLSDAQILSEVWDWDFRGDTKIVGSYVSVLRRKINTGGLHVLHTPQPGGHVLRLFSP